MWFRVGRKTVNEEGGIVLVQQWLHLNIKSSCCMVQNSCIFMEKMKFLSQKNLGLFLLCVFWVVGGLFVWF